MTCGPVAALGRDMWRDTWLRLAAHGAALNGRVTVRCGSLLPSRLESVPARKFLGPIHFCNLDCPDDVLAERLRARPSWRDSSLATAIPEHQRFPRDRHPRESAFRGLASRSHPAVLGHQRPYPRRSRRPYRGLGAGPAWLSVYRAPMGAIVRPARATQTAAPSRRPGSSWQARPCSGHSGHCDERLASSGSLRGPRVPHQVPIAAPEEAASVAVHVLMGPRPAAPGLSSNTASLRNSLPANA